MDFAGPEPELQLGEERPDPYLAEFTKLESRFSYTSQQQEPLRNHNRLQSARPNYNMFLHGSPATVEQEVHKALSDDAPQSPILLLRQNGADLFWRPLFLQRKAMELALSVIQQLGDEKRPNKPSVLVHIFWNGGSYIASQFTAAYRDFSPKKDELLPISALVLDSTPSLPSSRPAHTAISESLPESGPLWAVGSVAVW
ncbi:hypothetical protein LTR98_011661 [Exophiala xenobiotica]|nr:hypothetical protein LTR98_011661 [Exophiala xenobiotica]